MKHTIPLGTRVSFDLPEVMSEVFEVDQYQDVLMCEPDCAMDHDDHWPEPYINVRTCRWTSYPLSKIEYIFDPITHQGRKATEFDKRLVE